MSRNIPATSFPEYTAEEHLTKIFLCGSFKFVISPVEQLVQCGFEEPERFCELAQSTADEMDWSLMTGSTRSSDTGPSGAKTGRSYIYTEVSGKQEGDRAW